MSLFSLEGRVAVVTGGAGHLGFAMCEALAEFGANVVIASRNVEKCKQLAKELAKTYSVRAMGTKLDTNSWKLVSDCMKRIYKEMGSIDILVNNAAAGKPVIGIEAMSERDWIGGIQGTLHGVFRCTKAVIPIMKAKKYGVIINISSMYGVVSPDPRIYGDSLYNNPPDYGAGKAGIIQFTKYAACHLASNGIRVNAVSPGPFPSVEVQKNEVFITNLKDKVPLGRIGQPADLKGAVVFLASDASSYITGQNLIVDGGWTVW